MSQGKDYLRAQRLIVVDLSLRIIELNRDSYLPGMNLPDAALLLMLAIKIFEAQMKGRALRRPARLQER